MRWSLRFSWGGAVVAGVFLAGAGAVFGWLIYSASTNPADSGEGGVLLLPFAMPWVAYLPSRCLGLGTGLGCIGLNAFILYALFGGLRPARRTD